MNTGPTDPEKDIQWMRLALDQAQRAADFGEVPIGAVVVCGDQVISEAHNRREVDHNPLAHAEILAIESAAQKLGRWRLSDCTLYVTLEPCPMCAGALVQSRMGRVVFGALDPKAGALRSLYKIAEDPRLNHRLEVVSGVLEEPCAQILKEFFRKLRTV